MGLSVVKVPGLPEGGHLDALDSCVSGSSFPRSLRGLLRLGEALVVGRSKMGGFLIRRLLPAAIVVPVVLGWLRLEGQRAGLYGTGVGVLLTTTANVLIISALILWSARLFDRLEARRQQAE